MAAQSVLSTHWTWTLLGATNMMKPLLQQQDQISDQSISAYGAACRRLMVHMFYIEGAKTAVGLLKSWLRMTAESCVSPSAWHPHVSHTNKIFNALFIKSVLLVWSLTVFPLRCVGWTSELRGAVCVNQCVSRSTAAKSIYFECNARK